MEIDYPEYLTYTSSHVHELTDSSRNNATSNAVLISESTAQKAYYTTHRRLDTAWRRWYPYRSRNHKTDLHKADCVRPALQKSHSPAVGHAVYSTAQSLLARSQSLCSGRCSHQLSCQTPVL
eukprot:16587-Heterococcus_DN1.PRE.8